MVKNTKGGKGAKSMARKSQNFANKNIRFSEDPLEQYACVSKMLGNGMCQISLNDGSTLMGHIRNKFRGKQKRHNMISVNSVVLVGLREWESTAKNCDIIFLYDENHLQQLRNKPDIDIHNLIRMRETRQTFGEDTTDLGIDFEADEAEVIEEVTDLKLEQDFAMETGEVINIDDI